MTQREEIQKYLDQMKEVQKQILDFIENGDNLEEDQKNLIKFFDDKKIRQDKHELKATLRLIAQISNDHHRSPNLLAKIQQVILIFKKDIQHLFSNRQIFHIFRNSKRILLFLMEEKLINPDKSISSNIVNSKYPKACYSQYFYPEFRSFLDSSLAPSDPQSFDKLRKIGENDDPICKIIRDDKVKEFSSYVQKNTISLSSTINPSIFETNSFLIDKTPTLIEYSAFCGSIEIFKYLTSHDVELTPSLWMYAIHGQNLDIIHLLEEKKVSPEDESYKKCIVESIKCHHPEITNYIQNNLISDPSKVDSHVLSHSIKFYNYAYFPANINNDFSIFYDLCKFDYFNLVQLLVKNTHLDINTRRILKFKFF